MRYVTEATTESPSPLLLRPADVAADAPDRVPRVRERARRRPSTVSWSVPVRTIFASSRIATWSPGLPAAEPEPPPDPELASLPFAGRRLLSGAVVRRERPARRTRLRPRPALLRTAPTRTIRRRRRRTPTATRTRRTAADGCGRRREVGLRIARSSVPCPAADSGGARLPDADRPVAVPPAVHSTRCICPSSRPSSRCWPRPSDALPDGDGWLFEPKWDGFRAIVFRDGDEVLHPEPRPEAARPLLPGARRADPRVAPGALRPRRRGRHRPATARSISRRCCCGSTRRRRA